MIYRIKMARELNYMYGKHRPLMYNENIKNEMLRNFLMDQ